MSIQLESATDTADQVTAALGNKVDKPVESAEQKQSASTEETQVDETVDESDPSEENDSDESEQEPEEKPKKKGGIQKRIDKLTSRASAAEREREYWREQALRNQKTEPAKPDAKPVPVTEGKPKEEDFETHADWIDAVTDWKMDQRDKAKESERLQNEFKSKQDEIVRSYNERLTSLKEKDEDFDQKIKKLGHIKSSPAFDDAILTSEMGPQILLELSEDPEECERLNGLAYGPLMKAIGKIEARLAKESESTEPVKTKTTKAPAPITPVKTNSSGSGKKSIHDPDLSLREYEKLRRRA